MTTHKNITRILAVLLAVLLFGQLAAFQIPAFAADVVPDVHDGAAYIPDDADVNDLLSQTLLSNYSDVGTQEWEYKATSTLSGGATKWVPVTGTTAGIIPALTAGKAGFPALDVLGVSYPALDSQSPAQDYAVRLKGTTEVYTFTKLAQPADADTDTPADTPAQALTPPRLTRRRNRPMCRRPRARPIRSTSPIRRTAPSTSMRCAPPSSPPCCPTRTPRL